MRYCERCGAAFRFARTCPKDQVPLTAAAADPLIGRVLGGRYRVLERVGAGGMGQVYRAAHTRIACVFAVKVVWGDFAYDREMQLRFAREAETASCLSSRHIVRVVDFAEGESALPYLVMEYLDGTSLYDLIAREGALKPERAARIAERIARGLAHAHERGVVHRDLKPENVILVHEDDERDIPKILDFGVAKLRDGERLTGMGVAVGTPLYMAPEQFTGGEIDGRTDLYALGAVLHEMLTGRPPFEATSLPELTRQHLETPPPSVASRTVPGLDVSGLDSVVAQLMQKRASDRLGSAREAITLLKHMAAGDDAPLTERVSSLPSSILGQPAVPAALVATIEQAIVAGAPRYNAGDHAACYEGYRRAAEEVAAAADLPAAARLRAALARAATRTSPTDAAWDLRYAFDDLVAAPNYRPRGDRLTDCLAGFVCISGQREAEGRFDVVGDYQIAFADALAAELRSDTRYSNLVAALDRAAALGRAAGGGQAALPATEPILANLRVRGGLNVSAVSSSAPASQAAAPFVSDDTRERLVRAIRLGAPAYNEGRHDVCARVYVETAAAVVAAADPSQTGALALLKEAIERAKGRPDTEAAWLLRHAFDALLAGR